MILLEKRAHLVLKAPLSMVDFLLIDVLNQRAQISRTNGEHPVSALPCEARNSAFLHPDRRRRFNLRHNLRRGCSRSQSYRKMNMICDPANSEALAIQFASCPGKVSMKVTRNVIANEWNSILRTEDNMHKIETQRLRHSGDYISGLQPSSVSNNEYLGLRPRLVCHRTFGPEATEHSAARGNSHA